ncbi:MAG TPA: sialidase family protein [Thermoanaerobaculia bacterium]
MRKLSLFAVTLLCFTAAYAQSNTKNPTWWDKYQYILNHGPDAGGATTASVTFGSNIDVSNECGPQSETYITINTANTRNLAGGSNEIFRDPMRGYSSSDGGKTWSGVDLPLPPAQGANGTDFGSDPTLAFDGKGNLYYGYIVVFFGNGNGVNGTEMAVAKSTDGGKTYPTVTFFDFQSGSNHFNDKPMITTDLNNGNIYVAWDAASGGSIGGGIRVATSRDHGKTFTSTRADDPSGPGQSIGAVPFVGTNGELYVAWNDAVQNTIEFNKSLDGGQTWGTQSTVSTKVIHFDAGIPAEFSRRALVYPACDVDRSAGAHRGRLVCSWTDTLDGQTTDILSSFSDDKGATWSKPIAVTDHFAFLVDRFNQWLSIDPTNGVVNVAFYDTRHDTTGSRFQTDFYLSRSSDGGATYAPNIRVTNALSNEHDCNGVFPCSSINYGNQQGDYAGVVAYGGVTHPLWVDSRVNTDGISAACTHGLMEEVFTANVK